MTKQLSLEVLEILNTPAGRNALDWVVMALHAAAKDDVSQLTYNAKQAAKKINNLLPEDITL